jgi:uncharacterized protein (TIGR02246 family)
MKMTLLIASILLLVSVAGRRANSDEQAIREAIGVYVQAFNEHDVERLAQMWKESGLHVDRETGERTLGREAIRSDLADAFKTSADIRLSGIVDTVRMVTPNVARVEGTTNVGTSDTAPTQSSFSALLVLEQGRWLIDTIEETPVVAPATSYDALQSLEWLVGRWVDQSAEMSVETTVRWSANRSFLIRSFVTQTIEQGVIQEGTQVIGWDPRSNQIRSWTFNSDGSFGDGLWSSNGEEWFIRSSQTLADGRAASGTFVMKKVSDESIEMQLIGHEIEGDPQLTNTAVVMKRAEDATAESLPTATPSAPNNERGANR